MTTATQRAARAEAQRLTEMLPEQARLAVCDRIARAFLVVGDAHLIALEFNSHLVTELRVLAENRGVPNLWSSRC